MKAIRVHQVGGPEVMQLETLPDPKPGPQEVIVRVHAAGVNPVDTYIRAGNYPGTLPYTPGMDGAGVVAACGEGVRRVKVNDRVYIAGSKSGTYAELALCDQSQVHPLPQNVSFEQGAGIYIPYVTAYRALFHKAQAKASEVLLVHGASGGVGIAAVQLARAAGLRVFGTAGSEEGRSLVLEQGAHVALDHKSSDYFERFAQLNEGRGPDIILEMLANVNLNKDLSVIAKGGRIVIIGSRGKIEIDPRLAMARDAVVMGMVVFNIPPHELASIHAALEAGLENGTLHPVVGKKMPLTDAAAAHRAVLEPGAYGKIVLVP